MENGEKKNVHFNWPAAKENVATKRKRTMCRPRQSSQNSRWKWSKKKTTTKNNAAKTRRNAALTNRVH